MKSVERARGIKESRERAAATLFAAALVLAVLTRLAFILLPNTPLGTKAVESIGDSREYVALAENLAHHQTFSRDSAPPLRPELFRTPAYPLLLAPAFIVHRWPQRPLSDSTSFIVLALLVQLLLALATIWLTRKLALELGLAPKPAALAALLVALSPNLAFLSSKLISETLFTPLLLICLILLNRYRLAGRIADLVAAGACSGLLILTRPIATFFPILLAAYMLVHRSSFTVLRSSGVRIGNSILVIRNCALLLACASIVVAPWVIRNGVKTSRFIISTASEHNIYLYDAATVLASEKGITIPQARDSMMAEAQARFGPLDTNDEATMWPKLAAIARPHFFGRPALAAKVWLLGFLADFLTPISPGPLLIHAGAAPAEGSPNVLQSSIALLAKGRVVQAFRTAWQARAGGAPPFALVVFTLAALFNLILIVFGFIALFLRRTRTLLWLLLPILYFTLLTGTVGDARFRAPIEPLLCLLAAVALTRPAKTSRPTAE
jgi:hypothetical protein